MSRYKNYFDYIKENRNYVYTIIIIFFLSSVLGYIFSSDLALAIEKMIEQIMAQIKGMNFFQLLVFIFQNNLKTAFLGVLFGILFGVFPVILAVGNGLVLGYVSKLAINEGGIFSLWKLLPHGIFELPAVFLSFGFGLKLGSLLFMKKDKKWKKLWIKEFSIILEMFIYVIIPLLIIAAIIETGLIFLVN